MLILKIKNFTDGLKTSEYWVENVTDEGTNMENIDDMQMDGSCLSG